MDIIFNGGFNNDERQTYVDIIHSNVLVGIKELAELASSKGIDVGEKKQKICEIF